MEHSKHPVRRGAVYTRKSSEEGLEQDFNSLHAQRDACEAFIRSQAGEGWRLNKAHYDDGGLSGGSRESGAKAGLTGGSGLDLNLRAPSIVPESILVLSRQANELVADYA